MYEKIKKYGKKIYPCIVFVGVGVLIILSLCTGWETDHPISRTISDKRFDYDLIVAIYKVSKAWIRAESVRVGLERRFKDECAEALQMLKGER